MAKNPIIPYSPDLKLRARELRKNSTLAEILLWQEIKGCAIQNVEFHRQVPLLNFIVDFYCHELKLAIEVDGRTHEYKVGYDRFRQKELEKYGIRFLHFDDKDVKENMRRVLNEIYEWIEENQEK